MKLCGCCVPGRRAATLVKIRQRPCQEPADLTGKTRVAMDEVSQALG